MQIKFILAGLTIVTGSVVAGPHPKIARDLDGVAPDTTVNVIVQYKQKPNGEHLSRMKRNGGVHQRSLDLINGFVVRAAAKSLAAIADDPDVEQVALDHDVHAFLDRAAQSVNYYPVDSYLMSMNMAKGAVGLAIIDSGIDGTHPDFTGYRNTVSRIVYSESFVPGDTSTVDKYGHGTHVAGIAAGMDNVMDAKGSSAQRSFWGIAPDAQIVNLRVLDANGAGTDSTVIQGIEKAIALKTQYNIRVINLSLGRPVSTSYKNDLLCQAVEKAWKAGIVVVVAAGNSGRDNSKNNNGYGTITAPGNDPYVITVGAVNDKSDWDRSNDVIATYSSKGPTAIDHIVKPDLVAPGNKIDSYLASNSTLVNSYPANKLKDSALFAGGTTTASKYFFTLSGTSMAAPLVSGTAAVLVGYNPALTPDQVKARLMRTAWRGFPGSASIYDAATQKTYTAYHDIFTVGAGQLDVYAAFTDITTASGSAASPSAYYDTTSKSVKLTLNSTQATGIVWGSGIVWGTGIVWGNNVNGLGIVWGNGIVWGDSTNQGFGIVWGNASPWAASTTSTGESATIAINGEN